MKHYFTLTAQDALILSQNNATTGSHQTLDYIPGSAILGAFASINYPEDTSLAWALFHSGEVIYSNCYPIKKGQVGLPTPLSWHYKKGEQNANSISAWVNRAHSEFEPEENVQYEQLRGEYTLADGVRVRPDTAIRTKTAIDSQQGSAKKGQLFNYQHICEGQHFIGWIECPDKLDKEISQRLKGTVRIGRSKGSEFGRAHIAPLTLPANWLKTKKTITDQRLTIWCISDLELLDQNGAPTLSPCPKDIHPLLEHSSVIPSLTYIRYHSVNRFNGHRQCFDSESRLISKGSVITLKLDDSVDQSELLDELSGGVGINRHLGYGQIMVNPLWANQIVPTPPLFEAESIEVTEPRPIHIAPTPLTRWVVQRLNKATKHQESHENAISLAEQLIQGYVSARKFNHISDAYMAGPSRSQWRRINDQLRNEQADEWFSHTFEVDSRITKTDNDPLGWGIEWMLDGRSISFADYCKKHMKACSKPTLLKAIELLSRANPAENKGLDSIIASLRDDKVMTNNAQSNTEASS